ncbi:hypothetical protein DFH08DRAFT_799044 [Mycena albidolilacea]|uniref:Transmembrane protein n=1 Tax=Mycena albidolilacea TaxID=1033008 RepID=A0AAD7APT5_9AGAR|nr:hypothetical protein DFH08DRAFT_799044 [Mycena albidolilacea]
MAGEWFWFNQPTYKVNLFIHIYLSTCKSPSLCLPGLTRAVGGIGAVFQFIPAIRRRKVIVHRLNGYSVLTCLIVGNICGGIVGRRSFGGELNVQSGYYVMGLLVVVAALLGIYYVKKDTRRHRRWMLRMVVYFAATISARLIMLAAARIITIVDTYYSVWRCDEVLNLLTDMETVGDLYPQCAAAGTNAAHIWVAVHSSTHGGPLNYASALRAVHGMALWISTIIHAVAVEFYVRAHETNPFSATDRTEATNQVRLDYALEPLDFAVGNPPTSY